MQTVALIIVVGLLLLGFDGLRKKTQRHNIVALVCFFVASAYGYYFFTSGPSAAGDQYIEGLRNQDVDAMRGSMCPDLVNRPTYQTYFDQLNAVFIANKLFGGKIEVETLSYDTASRQIIYFLTISAPLRRETKANGWIRIRAQSPISFCVEEARTLTN